ncbi:uncharacterized protein LOC62_01G000860 [Vanrija pseudolonga]|uniref:BTB domain-containing protein n=1 Tax=Vanrija pseudolonga TaxID=143232 RepID=A0AAF0XZS4_9TREE|nr:hypothetical protein LOC62_01G000860 [Vanrija pseudolonga]
MSPSPLHTTHSDNIPLDHHHIIMDSSATGSPSRSLWERRNRNPRKAPSLPAPPRRHSPGYSMMPGSINSPRKTSAPELSPYSGGGRQSTPHTPRLGASAEIDGSYHATAAMARSNSDQNSSSTAPRSLRPRVDGRVVVPATHRDAADSDTAMESPSPTEGYGRQHSNSPHHHLPNSKPVIELGRRSDRHPVLDTPRASAASGREQRQDDSAMDTPRGSHHEYDFQQARRAGTIVSRNGSRTPSLPSAMSSMHRYSVASSGPRSAVSSGAGTAGSRTPSTPGYASPSGGKFAVRSPRVFSEARVNSNPYSRSSSSTSSYPATPSGLAIAPHHHHLFPRAAPRSPRNFSPRSPMSPAMPSPTLDHIPKDFVVKRLNKFAGTFWSNLSTSDVRLLVPCTKNCEEDSHIPFPPTPANGNMRADQAGDDKPKRVRAVPITPASAGGNRAPLRTLAFEVHRDYLVQQSSLLRTVLSEGTKTPSAIEMKGCRILATEPGAPLDIIVPLPDPSSLGILLHWMYWGDLEALETALNENPLKWKGMIANVNFLGLDQRTKFAVGRWWRRWAEPSATSKARPMDRDSIINDDPHVFSPEIKQEPILHSDDSMMIDLKPINRQLVMEADEVSERLRML